MSFKSSNPKYTNRFVGHFMRFNEEYRLFGKDEPLLIAVSGGIDSMVLVQVLNSIQNYGYSNKLRVAHINHGSRDGQDREETFVHEFCSLLGIESISVTLSDLDPNRNFEYKARLKRYEAFYQIANDNEKIVLAHHIDDSFEWTMLQSLRSSSIEGLIGVPVVNGRIIRPFMCATKDQIRRYGTCFDIPFIEDPTNELIKYERNFIRSNVVNAFKDRYNKYLKHYVYRHNEISRRLGLHLLHQHQTSFNISYADKSVLIYSATGTEDYSGVEQLVLKGLKHLNPDSRGKVSGQIKNVITALKNKKFGPISLTNGVKVYLDFNLVLMTKMNQPNLKFKYKSEKLFSYDEYINYIDELIPSKKVHLDFPFIVTIKGGNLDKRNFNTTFNTRAIAELKSAHLKYYPALKLLREWSKKKNRHKVLRLNFLTSIK